MKKLVLLMNVTLDGMMADEGNGLNWHFDYWSSEMSDAMGKQLAKADTILLGKNTYNAFAAYWPAAATCTTIARADIPLVDMMNRYRKVVFSKTLTCLNWNNTAVINGNLAKQVTKLKQQPGNDIIILGSRKLATALIKLNLINSFVLFVHPVTLGRGKPLFKGLANPKHINLTQTKIFESGVIGLYYDSN